MITDLSRGLSAPRRWRPSRLSGLRLWLSADRISGLADGDPVSTWSDLSGQGNHATQSTTAAKPLYKVGIANGRPVVRFDGVDDWLQTALFSAALSQPTTIFYVGPVAAAGYAFDGGSGSRHALLDNANVAIFAGTVQVSSQAVGATIRVFVAQYNGASSGLWINGASALSGVNAGAQTMSRLTIGARFDGLAPLAGDVAEVIIYNRALSTAERKQVERYLGARYGVAIS